MTYIYVGYDFNYLSLITDADLRRCGHRVRSDRGVQYCSFEYVKKLKAASITISMTDSGEAYESQMAERVNGILKHEFKLNQVFKSHMEAQLAIEKSIMNYI
jgi:transposase InsO family protein